MDQDAVGRIHAVMHEAVRDQVLATPGDVASALGLAWQTVDGADLVRASNSASILYNRAFADRPQATHLAALFRAFGDAGCTRFFLHLSAEHRSAALDAELAAVGIERYHRSWVTMAAEASVEPALATDLAIRRAEAGDAPQVGQLLCAGFDLEPGFADIWTVVIDRPRWQVYVACDGDSIAGAGVVFLDRGIGYLLAAATAPSYRKRGVQGALMARRVAAARQAGCDYVCSETGEAVAGEPQHSYHNMERCGMKVVATVDNYVARSA